MSRSGGHGGWRCPARAWTLLESRRPCAPQAQPGPARPPKFAGRAAAGSRPTCALAGSKPAAPREVCAWPRGRGGNFPPQPRPLPAAVPNPAGPARALGAATRTPVGKLRPGARSSLPRGLRSLTRQRVPEASAADRARPPDADSHPPKLAAGLPRVRHGAPGLGGAATSDPGARGRGLARGERAPGGRPRCPLARTHLARQAPLAQPFPQRRQLWVRRGPVTPVAPPEPAGTAG